MTKLLAKWVLWREKYCTVHLKPLRTVTDRWDEVEFYCPDCVFDDDNAKAERIAKAIRTLEAR
jgi:hypothetical protein